MEYKGLKRKRDDRDSTVLLCTKIISLPGEGEAKGKAKGKTKASDNELVDVVVKLVKDIITESGGAISKKDLVSTALKSDKFSTLSDRNGALKFVASDTWLKGRNEWEYDAGILSAQ